MRREAGSTRQYAFVTQTSIALQLMLNSVLQYKRQQKAGQCRVLHLSTACCSSQAVQMFDELAFVAGFMELCLLEQHTADAGCHLTT